MYLTQQKVIWAQSFLHHILKIRRVFYVAKTLGCIGSKWLIHRKLRTYHLNVKRSTKIPSKQLCHYFPAYVCDIFSPFFGKRYFCGPLFLVLILGLTLWVGGGIVAHTTHFFGSLTFGQLIRLQCGEQRYLAFWTFWFSTCHSPRVHIWPIV